MLSGIHRTVKIVTELKEKVINQFAEQSKDRTKTRTAKLLAFFFINTSSIWSRVEIRTEAKFHHYLDLLCPVLMFCLNLYAPFWKRLSLVATGKIFSTE